jgi:hypothetical protein
MPSIPMPIVFEKVPELIEELPGIDVDKELPYRKENRLDRLSRLHNEYNAKDIEKQTILDLPLKIIFNKLIYTIINIFSDITETSDYSLRNIIKILTTGDRIIYLGITLCVIAIVLFLVEMTN